jgi:eukaryotic-like serine/threonine-protein kinase
MDPQRWKQVDSLLQQALERPAEEREAFLRRVCGDDSALLGEVRSLLDSQQLAGSFLESPAIEMAAEAIAKGEDLSDTSGTAFEPGTMIAHYRLTGKLGEGGMGEVYRARDTKLQRDVALKILPQDMVHDAERMARFKREAQVLASLNHTIIAAIHGLEESNGVHALVMELVEGETLAERISVAAVSQPPGSFPKRKAAGEDTGATTRERGALPYEDALPIAKQIAEALEYAHEHGVIHRDLKPANVKITPEGTVKVLDFGLAKVLNPQDSSSALDPANSPSITAMATQPGMILGTAAYMSPEQAKGQRVDRRCDIWAFGCVLYEMLAGRKAFEGETISDVLAAVIRAEPDWTALPGTTPQSIQRLIRRCLQKDLRQRQRDIGDVRITIEETISGVGEGSALPGASTVQREPRGLPYRALPWVLAATTILFAAVAAYFVLQHKEQRPVIRFTISSPEKIRVDFSFHLSPDGRHLAVAWSPSSIAQSLLWVHSLDSLTSELLQGTDGAVTPFWSPDSRYIGFYANGKLKKIALSGGPPQTLCDAAGYGATWNRDGVILFSNQGGLYRVPDMGGAPTLVAAPDRARPEGLPVWPQFLPDGRHFLFHVSASPVSLSTPNGSFLAVGDLGSGKTRRLVEENAYSFYASPGYLIYAQGGDLVARAFDAKRLQFTGQAVLLVPRGAGVGASLQEFSASENGTLVYEAGAAAFRNVMIWFNRKGEKVGTVGQQGFYSSPAISPYGTKVAVGVGELGARDIWVYELKQGTGSRLTFSAADDLSPVWSADGSRIMFTSTRRGGRDLYQKPANGLGKTELVFADKNRGKSLYDWSRDGRYVIYGTAGGAPTDLLVLPLFGERKPLAFAQGGFRVWQGEFSPRGQYVAYSSTQTGKIEVYVQTFPQRLGNWQISTSGGSDPMWRRDGRELFYLSSDNKLMVVDVKTNTPPFQAGIPKPLFQTQPIPGLWRNRYVVSPDGQRFLMLVPAGDTKPEPITVVVNWPALLKKQ